MVSNRFRSKYLLATLILSTSFVGSFFADAIKCYVCQSNIDPKCADPFDNFTLPITDCDAYPRADLVTKTDFEAVEEKSFFLFSGSAPPVKPLMANLCRKIRQKVNGEWRTIRGCGYLGSTGDLNDNSHSSCHVRHGTHDVFMETCICNNKAGCNGSAGLFKFSWMDSSFRAWIGVLAIQMLVSLISSMYLYRGSVRV